MAYSANLMRQTLLKRLQTELQAEVTLANKLSCELNRVAELIHIREIHMAMLHAMPLTSLNSYGLHALLMTHEKCAALSQVAALLLVNLKKRNQVGIKKEIGIHLNTKIQHEVEERKNLKLWSFTKWTLKRIVIVKLCLEYEIRKGKKLVKNELMVLLRGEIYFVQFIINPEEDEFELGLVFERSFLRSANAIVNFREGTITIQPDFDPFLLSSDEEGNLNLDNLETLLDFDLMRPSSFFGTPLTQEEAERRALAHRISMRYEMLEEVRPVIETLAYNDKYKKLLDEIWADKVRLDGKIKPEEERAMAGGLINENALADTGSDTNTMPYRIYEQLGGDDIMQEERNITLINYTEAEVTGQLVNVLCQVGFTTMSAQFLILEIPIDRDAPIVVGRGFLDTIGGNIDIPNRILTTFDGLTRQTFRAARSEKVRIAESDSDDEEDYVIKRNDMGTPIHNSRPIGYQNNTNPAENITLSTLESLINPFRKISVWKKAVSFLGSLPAKLRDVEWKPNYKLCYSNPELATGQWKTEIRLTDPYGNIYMQAFVTKPTKRKLSKYNKLSDIMSPNCVDKEGVRGVSLSLLEGVGACTWLGFTLVVNGEKWREIEDKE
ncbi:ribonuclease H-like domain-containing protein [Tanacetum coccineum]